MHGRVVRAGRLVLTNSQETKMKVVAISNFDVESVAEFVISENGVPMEQLTDQEAKAKADDWNNKNCHDHSRYFAVAKPDDYKLWRGMEELV